ncbi:phospholipid carrier-dependent glycosyltransferase [Asticcacaulis sp. AND118]|uniref:phospholipid carrier-dependent glycosyltransferase n=1 Tax=Asticcacaulis sp. AND118 TaxID=2840468 RepID=UPI001CFF8919|nr:phospholipid carrier-dependent glycosyltransferase [Asticcacaulis sp. AND118]UDF05385.1 phospholipid carrier-dependent glycosyltransferase [Asticcacaulis sp. AND118]
MSFTDQLQNRWAQIRTGKWGDEPLMRVLGQEPVLRWLLGFAILCLASFNFARDLNDPRQAFWDESYYVTALERYEGHVASYASHPPLGFMLMKVGRDIVGDADAVDSRFLADIKKTDTRKIPDGYSFTGVRLMGGLFGAVGAVLFYLICLTITREAFSAAIFSLLYVFENALIVHFRAGHLDPFQITFALGGILVWLRAFCDPKKDSWKHAALFGALIGLSFMVKVNTLVLLALPGFTALRDLIRSRWPMDRTVGHIAAKAAAVSGAFAAIVVSIFVLHTLVNPVAPDFKSDAGRKDLPYITEPYKAWLEKRGPLTPQVLYDATNGYFGFMNNDFTGIVKTEKNGSNPALWPVMHKTITYRWDSNKGRTSYVQMAGNLFNWTVGGLALIAALVLLAQRAFQKKPWLDTHEMDVMAAVLGMWGVFMGIHIWLGTQRVMYIYHYFAALLLSFMLLPLLYQVLKSRFTWIEKQKDYVLGAVCLGAAAGFIWISPLTYHQPLTRSECEARNIPFKLVRCEPKVKPAGSSSSSISS